MTGKATEESAIYVGQCALGLGIFAGRNFRKNEFLFRFSGPIITLAEAIAKGEAEGNVLQIGPSSYIDLETPAVFGNHSCEPNSGLRDDVRCYALRDIAKDEEIFYDYSTTMSERRWTMRCKCGASRCRGTIGDFHDLLPELQRRYLAMRIVQPFIVEEIHHSRRMKENAALALAAVRRRSGPLSSPPGQITRYAPC